MLIRKPLNLHILYVVAGLTTEGPGSKTSAGPLFESFINQVILQIVFRQNSNAAKLCSVASDELFVSFLYINEL